MKGILAQSIIKATHTKKYCRAKGQKRKHELHTLFKQYWNSLDNIIKVSKVNHFHQYFATNKRNLLKVWEGIKEIIHTKSKIKQSINSLRFNGTLCTGQNKTANSVKMIFYNIYREIIIIKKN